MSLDEFYLGFIVTIIPCALVMGTLVLREVRSKNMFGFMCIGIIALTLFVCYGMMRDAGDLLQKLIMNRNMNIDPDTLNMALQGGSFVFIVQAMCFGIALGLLISGICLYVQHRKLSAPIHKILEYPTAGKTDELPIVMRDFVDPDRHLRN